MLDGVARVVRADAPEDPANDDKVCRHGAGVGVGDRRVASDDVDVPVELELADEVAGCLDVARVELDKPGADVCAARMRRDDGQELAALSRTRADDAHALAKAALVEECADVAVNYLGAEL